MGGWEQLRGLLLWSGMFVDLEREKGQAAAVAAEETEEEDVAEERDDTCWCCYCQPREEGSAERERGLVIAGWGGEAEVEGCVLERSGVWGLAVWLGQPAGEEEEEK